MQVMDSDSDGRASELFDYFKVCICFAPTRTVLLRHSVVLLRWQYLQSD